MPIKGEVKPVKVDNISPIIAQNFIVMPLAKEDILPIKKEETAVEDLAHKEGEVWLIEFWST